jgi:aspartate racemase
VRKASLFQKHPQWKTIEKYLLWPDEEEQAEIQSFIYEIKKNRGKYSAINNFISLLSRKYQINSFIAGCTEFHLLTKYFMELEPKEQNYYIVDPLLTIAKSFQTFMDA